MVWSFIVLRVNILPADKEELAFVVCLTENLVSEGFILREYLGKGRM